MNVRHLRPVEVVDAERRHDRDTAVFLFVIFSAGLLLGGTLDHYIMKGAQAPATCPRLLEDGRRLMANDLGADGRETRCVFEAPHPNVNNPRKSHGR